jgi:hypothetical protein
MTVAMSRFSFRSLMMSSEPSLVLGPEEIESFVELGFCMVRQAFTAEQASRARRVLWTRMEEKAGIFESRPETWPDVYDIEEQLKAPEVLECFSDRLAKAIDELVGHARWSGDRRWGFWPVNFASCRRLPYDFPSWGWHIDGNWFLHTLNSPNQGLLVVGLFTDIEPRWGGTIVALGSHKRTARVLARHPEGLHHRDVFAAVLEEPLGNFHELTGKAGDAALCHPFLFHTRGMKHGGPPRIISNTEAPLRAPMNIAAPAESRSVLEWSIRKALDEPPRTPAGAKLCRF